MINKEQAVLLAHLRKSGRAKLTNISRDTGIAVSSLFEKLKGPLSSHIKRFTCILDNSETGFNSRATIILKVDKDQKEEMCQYLARHQNVNSLFRINNGFDFLLDVIFRQMANLEEFIEELERKFKVKHRDVYFIISEVKEERFLSEPEQVHLLLGEAKKQ